MNGLDNKVVIITGGSGNLGSALVDIFSRADATVVAPDRSAQGIAESFPVLDANKHFFPGNYDALDAQANHRLVQDTLARYGRIDIVVNTIGGYRAGSPLHETSIDTWEFMLNLNARTAFLLSKAVLPAMVQQRDGVIIHTAAYAAIRGRANESAYAASKAAVTRMVESMHEEYKNAGITVNAILPGTMDTPSNRASIPNADFSNWVQPAHVAECVLFLTTDAGRTISGALIPLLGKQ